MSLIDNLFRVKLYRFLRLNANSSLAGIYFAILRSQRGIKSGRDGCLSAADGYQLSAIGCQLSAAGFLPKEGGFGSPSFSTGGTKVTPVSSCVPFRGRGPRSGAGVNEAARRNDTQC